MTGILGGMGTQAGLDFCNKLAVLNRRSEEHTSELQSLVNIVCRRLLEKKKST